MNLASQGTSDIIGLAHINVQLLPERGSIRVLSFPTDIKNKLHVLTGKLIINYM